MLIRTRQRLIVRANPQNRQRGRGLREFGQRGKWEVCEWKGKFPHFEEVCEGALPLRGALVAAPGEDEAHGFAGDFQPAPAAAPVGFEGEDGWGGGHEGLLLGGYGVISWGWG